MTAPPPGWPGQQPGPPTPYGVPYPAPGYPEHRRDVGGYPPPGYPTPPGFPGPGYGQPGYGYPAWKPGVIPLRPLTLTDIFNGAVAYVRANPKPTLGLTTVVILATSIIGFVFSLLLTTTDGTLQAVFGAVTGGLATLLATVLLSGMLTVIVGRSVLGSPITAADAWRRVRPRMLALIGLTLLEIAAMALVITAAVLVIAGIAHAAGGVIATLIGIPLALVAIAALAYLGTSLLLAPAAIVLEGKNIPDAITRSLALVRGRFWRTFGILILAGIAVGFVAAAISVPFSIAGSVITLGAAPHTPTVGGTMVATVGQAIGQIIITPFLAGVTTLLYVDARIRSEAFDFALMTAPPGSDVDHLWHAR